MDNSTSQTRPDRHGCNNPMAGKHHSLATRQQQSLSHRQYQEKVRRAMKDSQVSLLSMGQFLETSELRDTLRKIIKEEIEKLL